MKKKILAALEEIRQEMETIPGHTGFYYQDLSTGFSYGVRENEAFLAASVIKFPLLLHVLEQCRQGSLSLDQVVAVTPEEKVPSCGALNLMTGTVQLDIRSLCRLMIAISDNTATNKLIRLCGIPEINQGFQKMGLQKTVLRRLLFDAEASRRGLENTICPREIGMLLEKLYRREGIYGQDPYPEAMDMLLHQQIDHKLDGKLCGQVEIAHKTGEDTNLSNDVGIVFAREPFILCFAAHDTDVYRWEDLIRRGAYDVYMESIASVND